MKLQEIKKHIARLIKEQEANGETNGGLPTKQSADVKIILTYIEKIDTKVEWIELLNGVIDHPIKGMEDSVKVATIRKQLSKLS